MFNMLLDKIIPNRNAEAKANLSALKKSVCLVVGEEGTGFGFGNGVFLRRDVILTCHHNIMNLESIYVRDGKGHMVGVDWKSKLNRYDGDLDAVILKLEAELDGTPAKLGGDTEDYLQNLKGFMVTKYTGAPVIKGAQVRSIGVDNDADKDPAVLSQPLRRAFASAQAVQIGYSGSPIFDSRGQLSSLACSYIFNRNTVLGPTPKLLSHFIQDVLALS